MYILRIFITLYEILPEFYNIYANVYYMDWNLICISYMTIEPNLHMHIIGFPHHANSENNNNGNKEEEKQDIKIGQNIEPTSIYEPLYEISNKYLENGYSILYLAESLPNKTDKAKVVENIQNVNNNTTEEVQNNISKGLLTVIDSDAIYKDNAGSRYIIDFLLSNLSKMQLKLQDQTKGTMICNAPDPFFNRNKYDDFMMFEEEVGKILPKNVGLICWYKKKWLSSLSLAHIIHVLVDHKYTIHSNWKYKEFDTNKIIDLVSKGIDKNLGEGSAVLLFQTMKSAYKLNQDVIVYKPSIFEEALKRILDKDDANYVIDSIFEEIIREVAFSLTGSSSNKRK